MQQHQENSEEMRPEDDWDLPQAPRPTAIETTTKTKSTSKKSPAVVSVAQSSAPDPTIASSRLATTLPHRSKVDHYPAFLARGALFSASKHASPLAPNTPIKSQGSYNMRASGGRLRMRDKAVWEAAMQVAKESGDAGRDIPVSLSDLARRMGLQNPNGATLAWIWASLERLARTNVEVTLHGQVHAGRMLESATSDGRAHTIRVDLAWTIAILEQDFQFKLNSARRHMLSGSLAKWLHDFVSTHASYDRKLTIGYLRDLCGFDGQSRRFPSLLDAALLELSTTAPELIAGHTVKKIGRSSDKWELDIKRGQESPSFCKPKARATLSGPCVAPSNGRSPRKWLAL